jgi:hypothetical protein
MQTGVYPCINDDSIGIYGENVYTCTAYFDANPSSCGNYDGAGFNSLTQCCACGGGTTDVIGVSALKDITTGYTKDLCIECTNGEQTIQKSGWIITLADCSNTLSLPATGPSLSLTYSSSAGIQ